MLLLALLGAALGGTARARPLYSPLQDNVVISEFRSRGPNGASDEFVELFNPTSQTISIGGWYIKSVSSSGSMTTRFTIPAGTQLLPGQHFLVATATSGISPNDGTLSAGIADDGGVALVYSDNTTIIDQAGMSASAAEGTPLPTMSGSADQSYERKPGGSNGNCQDTDDNASDFVLISPSFPQHSASPLTGACIPPTPTFTDTFTPTHTFTSTHTFTATYTSTSTFAYTVTFTETPTLTPTLTIPFTPTATFQPPAHVVIAEFRTRGPNGAGDEFIELYNPTGAAVNIGGWTLKRSSGCGTTTSTLATIGSNVLLQPGQHYLLVSDSSASVSGADQTFSPGMVETGGLALFNAGGLLIDQVGLCSTTTFVESPALAALSGDLNQSYQRKPGGLLACQDTDHNASDFTLITPSDPQNSAAPLTLCAGAVTPTFTPTATFTPTRTPTPRPTVYPGAVVLNEILPRPLSDWNGDGEVNSRDEYIEIINLDVQPITLKNWKLDDGPGGSAPYALPAITLQPYEIARFFALQTGIALSDAGDTARLIKPDNTTADSWTYPPVPAADQTWCRLPDGSGAWGFVCRPTPGRPNARLDARPAEGPAPVKSPCPLPDTAPQPFRLAECEAGGGGIWRRFFEWEFFVKYLGKQEIFVK